MKMRLFAAILCCCLCLGVFASCGKGEQGTEDIPREEVKTLPETLREVSNKASYTGMICRYTMEEGEKLLDIAETGDGLLLLVGVPASFSAEDGSELSAGVPAYDTYLQKLDRDFREVSVREKTPGEKPYRSLAYFGEDVYAFVLNQVESVGDYAEMFHHIVLHNGERISGISSPCDRFSVGSAEMWTDGGAFYLCGGVVGARDLFIDGKRIRLPEPAGETYCDLIGVVSLRGRMAALCKEESYQGQNGYGAFSDKALLIPFETGTDSLEAEGSAWNADLTGLCATDGTLGYFTDGTDLCATDGTQWWRIADLGLYGFTADSDARRLLPLSDGRIAVLFDDQLLVLSEGESGKEILCLGICGYDDMSNDLYHITARFNLENSRYGVETRTYETQEKLNLAILAGEVDLLASGNLFRMQNYAEKGILSDLEKKVPSVFEEGVVLENVTEALRDEKGGVYFIPRVFSVYGMYLRQDLYQKTGGEFSSLSAFMTFCRENGRRYMKTREQMSMLYDLARDPREWIGRDGKAHFTDGVFEELLEFSKECAVSIEEIENASNQPEDMGVFSLESAVQGTMLCGENALPGDMRYLPAPSDRWKGSDMAAPYFVGIAANTSCPEGTGEFVKYLLLPHLDLVDLVGDERDFGRWCVNREAFEAKLFRGVEEAGDATPESEKEADAVRAAILSSDHFYCRENPVYDVIAEEASRFFRGEITAAQAAEYVQNRVSIYLAEQG